MRRLLASLVCLTACSTPKSAPPGAPPAAAPDAAPATPAKPAPALHGSLRGVGLAGEDVTLDGKPLTFIREGTGGDTGAPRDGLTLLATRCREDDLPGFNLRVDFYPKGRGSDDFHTTLFSIGSQGWNLGRQEQVEKVDDARGGGKPPRALAWFVPGGAALPDGGWLQVDAFDAPDGPIDLSFELDWGARGKVGGRVLAPKLDVITCRIPSPPAEPRP